MNSKQRLLAAIRREPVDRVPANIYYYMQAFYEEHFPSQPGQDPWEASLESQTRFGFDPLIGLGGGRGLPWQVNEPGRWEAHKETNSHNGDHVTKYVVNTPAGQLSVVWDEEPGHSGWQLKPLITEEAEVDALAYLPSPTVDIQEIDRLWAQLGDRGLGWVMVYGIWQQACYIRGMEQMAMDPYIRPEWTERFLGYLTDYLAAQTEVLCQSRVETLYINESYVGMGISKSMFDEFVRPYDERLVHIGKEQGKLVLYHDCGKTNALLESFADLGIDYLEPLTPKSASGDVDLADAKRRIGNRVCIRGGFNHHLLTHGTPKQVRQDVIYCLETLSPGGGYILCPTSALNEDARMENLWAFAEAAADYCGAYGTP